MRWWEMACWRTSHGMGNVLTSTWLHMNQLSNYKRLILLAYMRLPPSKFFLMSSTWVGTCNIISNQGDFCCFPENKITGDRTIKLCIWYPSIFEQLGAYMHNICGPSNILPLWLGWHIDNVYKWIVSSYSWQTDMYMWGTEGEKLQDQIISSAGLPHDERVGIYASALTG
jgi:hypothetical protein